MPWTVADMPRLNGRTVIVTGANSGLGYCTALALANSGADVTLAVRSVERGEAAARTIRASVTSATVSVASLDLADLTSIRAFAQRFSSEHPSGLDLLINNAGIMAVPKSTTADGFEMQFGTNHLGHVALTGLLLPALVAVPGSRVVTVSSFAHRMGKMNFADLMGARSYRAWGAYGQSKLANLLFTAELQRRLSLAAMHVKAMSAHPGYANTNLQTAVARKAGRTLQARMTQSFNNLAAQSAQSGALPTLFAATAPGLPGDSFVGPDGFMQLRGHPVLVDRSAAARDMEAAATLWQVSEQLTAVHYPFD